MNKIFNSLSYYYILVLLGLIGASWIIWSRFLRERVIRDVPDSLLTEYRVWILMYICCIYLYVIKNLIIETEPNIYISAISKEISTYIWKPLITLDNLIKYNKYFFEYNKIFIIKCIKYWDNLSENGKRAFTFSFQIIPRIILVIFLLLDTFYFHKIEIFYKIILLGLLPFTMRYIEYSIKDFNEYLVTLLIDKYEFVFMYEKGYKFDRSHKERTEAIWHNERVSMAEYIEILYDTYFENIRDNTSFEYVGDPYCKDSVYSEYEKEFDKPINLWTEDNRLQCDKLFDDLVPIIIDIKLSLFIYNHLKKKTEIVWPKIGIFSMYLICWGYILIISYYYYPIELSMFKYFVNNILTYLVIGENPFIENLHSINENLITIENVKNLASNIIELIMKKINNIIK